MGLLGPALAGAVSLAIFAPAPADAGAARSAESAGRVAIPVSASSTPHTLTLPEIVELRETEDIRLSPDGKTIAFLLKQASVRENDDRIAPELVFYPDEGIFFQPRHRISSMQRNLDWMSHWILGEEDPDSGKREQYARWKRLCGGSPEGEAP